MFTIGTKPQGTAKGTELWMNVQEDDGQITLTEYAGWVITSETIFRGMDQSTRAQLVIEEFTGRLASREAAVDDGYSTLLTHLDMIRAFHLDDQEEGEDGVFGAGFDVVATIDQAVELIRTHALPADHPLAIN